MHCNPVLKAFADRLRAAGKRGQQIVAAVRFNPYSPEGCRK
jgi:hypothetical protein